MTIAALEAVGPDDYLGGLHQFLRRHRYLHAIYRGGTEQPVDVVGKPENRRPLGRLVGADALEDSRTIV
jgi:hypothetical protein